MAAIHHYTADINSSINILMAARQTHLTGREVLPLFFSPVDY